MLKPLDGMRCHLGDTHVVLSNIIRQGLRSPREGEIWGSQPRESQPPVRSDAAYRQSTLALVFKNVTFLCRVRIGNSTPPRCRWHASDCLLSLQSSRSSSLPGTQVCWRHSVVAAECDWYRISPIFYRRLHALFEYKPASLCFLVLWALLSALCQRRRGLIL